MKKILSPTFESNLWNELSLMAVRLFAGLSIALAHGLGKLPPSQGFVSGVAALGFSYPMVFAWAAALSEFVGGLLLALGLFTRPAAFFLTTTMSVAVFMRHSADPFARKELALLYLALFGIFLFRGAGRFSIDRLIK